MGKNKFSLIFFFQYLACLVMIETGAAVGDEFVGIHVDIIQQKLDKVKGPKPLFEQIGLL